jgi:hypothetical protein
VDGDRLEQDNIAVDDLIEMPDLDGSDLEEDRDCFDFDDEENQCLVKTDEGRQTNGKMEKNGEKWRNVVQYPKWDEANMNS